MLKIKIQMKVLTEISCKSITKAQKKMKEKQREDLGVKFETEFAITIGCNIYNKRLIQG